MSYTNKQIQEIYNEAIEMITKELEIAVLNNNVDAFLDKYNLIFDENPIIVDRNMSFWY